MIRLFSLALFLTLISCKDLRPSATATLQIHHSRENYDVFSERSLITTHHYTHWEVEPIISEQLLQTVSEETGFSPKFLEDSLYLKSEGDFIKIIAHHDDQNQAVIIANTVAETHVAYRKKQEESRTQAALSALDQELEKQREVINLSKGPEREAAQDMFSKMILKQSKAREILALPQEPVSIHERAK